jgi:hypothetical protein
VTANSSPNTSKAKRLASVTPFAIIKVRFTKRAPVVMTRSAAPGASGRKVLCSPRRCHLPPLRQSGAQRMTVRTVQPLSRSMFRVTEAGIERRRVRGCTTIPGRFMTRRARADVAPAESFPGRVALVTIVVRSNAAGNRHRCPASQRRRVTGRAVRRRSRFTRTVLRVIELSVETFLEPRGKSTQRRIAAGQARMTDVAHRNLRRDELGQVTIGACLVSGELRCS